MKKITLLLILALSVAFVTAGDEAKKSGCNKKKCAQYGNCNKAGAATTTDASAPGTDTASQLCPTMATGSSCAHPDQCPYSHEKAASCTCDKNQKKSLFNFWSKSEKCDHCKTKNT
ncbi:MAG: hypothetical protein H8D46_02305 [FCB group bacterium]|nr:hypothetical protein [FCB group bacterium]